MTPRVRASTAPRARGRDKSAGSPHLRCAFAGDRGLLHPELTASATRAQAAEIRDRRATAHASANRTCEIGMSRATGETYRHLLELLEQATRPAETPARRPR